MTRDNDHPGLRARTDRTLIRSTHRSERYLLVELDAPAATQRHRREPVNIAFVLDRSGSMAGRKLAVDRGNTIYMIPASELANWEKASSQVDDDWVKEVSAKGANGKALLEEARALIRQYDK